MDSFQPSHNYIRPPPPPPHTVDPRHHQFHQHHQIQQPRQPVPPQGPLFSSQFQYHPSQTPPPPPQWAPPPPPPPSLHSDQFPQTASYPPPPNNFPASHSYHHNQFPPSHVPPHSHIPQPYSQDWRNPNWPPNQGWDYPAHKNEEDWAARARAWADAKAAMESQHSQSQFAPAGKPQDQTHYYDHYQQSVESHYPDFQNQSHPPSNHQQFPLPDASLQQQFRVHPQDVASVRLETSYASDGQLPCSTREGTATGDTTVAFQHQGNLPTNPLVNQQEVPSSYSSVTGKETADQNQQLYALLPSPGFSSQEQQQHMQPYIQASFPLGSHPVDPATSLADQPLDFAPRFNRGSDLQMQSTYVHHDSATSVRGIDSVTGVPSMTNWAPPEAHGVAYPPIPPVIASGQQIHDSSITMPPIPGHVAPPFGRFPGPSIPPTIPPSGAPFVLGSRTTIQPTAAFSADTYGVSGTPERPKKASVPNWLKEEIKKAVIFAPSVEHPKEETKFVLDDNSYLKGDEQDSKSIDSSKSAEEEEDDEDYVEATRTAEINQEIKGVLTEVLMKVTDELFDEIATKILSEDDLTAEEGQNVITSNHKAPASPPSASVPKASAKILVPVKAKESENEGDSEKSSSSSPGDVLGLGNYASDDDDGADKIENSGVPTPENDVVLKSGINNPLESMHDVADNSNSQLNLEENGRNQTNMVNSLGKTYSVDPQTSNGHAIGHLHDDKMDKGLDHVHPSKLVSQDRHSDAFEKRHNRSNGSSSKTLGITKSELPEKNDGEKVTDNRPGRESRTRSEKTDRHDKGSYEKDFVKEVQSSESRADEKGDENHRKKDGRHQKKEKADDSNETKERVKEHNGRQGEKAKELESRKRPSHIDVKDNRKDSERAHRSSTIDDNSRKKEHAKDKGEHRSRHKDASNSDKHRRRHSSSVSSRSKSSRDRAVINASDSSGEDSDGSKRKPHSRKRDLSPSPVKSRKRQVSRSPHSKRSQLKHSSYSSLDTSRGGRSRSRSPVRRQR